MLKNGGSCLDLNEVIKI